MNILKNIAKTDKTKAPPPAVTASAVTTTAAKKQTRLTSLSAKTPSTSRVSTLKSTENNATRSTRKKQAVEEKQDDNEQNESTSTANETTNTQKEDITVISTSAVIPETPPTVGRMSTRNRVQSKTEETSLVEPKPRSSLKKTPVTALKSPVKKTPEVENDHDEASNRRRSTRSQTVEGAQRVVESPKEPTVAPKPSGASRIQIARASSSARTANKPVASESSTSTSTKGDKSRGEINRIKNINLSILLYKIFKRTTMSRQQKFREAALTALEFHRARRRNNRPLSLELE